MQTNADEMKPATLSLNRLIEMFDVFQNPPVIGLGDCSRSMSLLWAGRMARIRATSWAILGI